MGFSPNSRRGGPSRTVTAPPIRIRSISQQSTKTNTNAGLVGDMRTDLFPLEVQTAAGEIGGRVTVEKPGEVWLDTRDGREPLEDLRGVIFTIELARSVSNRALGEILFKGVFDSEEPRYRAMGEYQNRRTFGISDWAVLDESTVRIANASDYTAGALLNYLELGYLQKVGVAGGNPYIETQVMDPYPLPVDGNGNPSAEFSQSLKNNATRLGSLSLMDVSTGKAVADIITSIGLVPVLDYGRDGKWVIDGRVPGYQRQELICGANGFAAKTYTENVCEFGGSRSYRATYNRAVAFGQPVETVATIELVKDWTSQDEAEVLADPTLLNAQSHRHVGRRYKHSLNKDVRFSSMIPSGTAASGKTREARVWSRFEGDSTSGWRRNQNKWAPVSVSVEGVNDPDTTQGSGGTLSPKDGQAIEFEQPQWIPTYWTQAEQATRLAGTPVAPSSGFLEIFIEATILGAPLRVEASIDTDYPIEKTRTFFHPTGTRRTFLDAWEDDGTGRATDVTEAPTVTRRDDSGIIYQRLIRFLEENSYSKDFFSATVPYFNPSWAIAQDVTELYDRAGNVILDGFKLYVAGVNFSIRPPWVTRITFTKDYQSLLQGAMIGQRR